MKTSFFNPSNSARPEVYCCFMDGNQEMITDLESVKEVGISNLIFFEMGIGAPRRPVDFMSEEWQDLYVYAVREAERLKKIFLRAGLGWWSSGGLWVTPEESMKQVVYSWTGIKGNKKVI